MHIAFVAPEYPPGRSANGITTYTAIMAEELGRRGHRITVFCQKPDGAVPGNAADTVRAKYVEPSIVKVPLWRIFYYRCLGRVFHGYVQGRDTGTALHRSIDLVHWQDPIDLVECPEVRGVACWLYALSMPVTLRLHAAVAVGWTYSGAPWGYRQRAIARVERRALRHAEFVSAPSTAVVEETKRILNVELPHARIIPNPCPPAKTSFLEAVAQSPRTILFVGNVSFLKGFDLAIDAFVRLASQTAYEDVCLEIAGAEYRREQGGFLPVSAESYIREKIADAHVRSRIKLLGRLSADDVRRLRRPARITIVPSRFENFPNTVLEAMAAGCALVAAQAGGIVEIVEHERNGLFFRAGDSQDLARQIVILLDNPDFCERLGRQARQDVQARFSPQVIGDRMEAYYREVIDRSCSWRSRSSRRLAPQPEPGRPLRL